MSLLLQASVPSHVGYRRDKCVADGERWTIRLKKKKTSPKDVVMFSCSKEIWGVPDFYFFYRLG